MLICYILTASLYCNANFLSVVACLQPANFPCRVLNLQLIGDHLCR